MADATKKTAVGAEKDVPVARASRGGVVQFYRDVMREGIQKVTWPTFKEAYLTTIMVFIMVGVTMVFFFAVDWILAMGERWIIGAMG